MALVEQLVGRWYVQLAGTGICHYAFIYIFYIVSVHSFFSSFSLTWY